MKAMVCISHNANILGKGMNPTILSLAIGKIIGQTGRFNFDMATGQGEGKL